MKIAAIDIGTNAIKSKIFDTTPTSIDFKEGVRTPIRLGTEVFLEGKIPKKKLIDLSILIDKYIKFFKQNEVQLYEIVATSAFRDTNNSEESRRFIEQKIGQPVRIISGFEEANLIKFHPDASLLSDKFFVDIGGGSTEFFQYSNNNLHLTQSFQLGAVRNMLKKDKLSEWDRMSHWLNDNQLNSKLIGIGGNIRSFFRLCDAKTMDADMFLNEVKLLSSIKKDKKINLFNLSEDRADVIDEALKIYSKIIKKVRPKKIKATKWGVADSISVKLFHELYAGNIKIRN
ncbi:MAG: Ppx/GppA phosphatase family protein [Gammaproteobacteria bacterium]|tara:strand:+ start:2557 stop:3417 length:861 start_codon:yes stop_codon:yes gene_type:complete